MKHSPRNPLDEYQLISWPMLEQMASSICSCCNEGYNKNNPPDLTAKCHMGPVFISYWEDFIYLSCGTCETPICKIPINKSLILGQIC